MRIQICNWAHSRMGLWGYGVMGLWGFGVLGSRGVMGLQDYGGIEK